MEAAKKPLYKSLYFQVICAIILGIGLGHFAPETAQAMKPLGDGFIRLIKMAIAPIISGVSPILFSASRRSSSARWSSASRAWRT